MENYSVSLSELSKLYNIDKSVLKKIIKKISKKTKKRKAKAKVKSQSIKFSNKKPQENNEIRYSFGSVPVKNNAIIDSRDAQIINERINDLKLNNKLLITDVLPNLVNASQSQTTDLFNQMGTRVNQLTDVASQKFQYLFDNVGDWKDTRQLINPNLKEEQDQNTNRLSNIPNTFNIRLGEIVEDENPSFYNDQPDTIQIPPAEEEKEIVQPVEQLVEQQDEQQDDIPQIDSQIQDKLDIPEEEDQLDIPEESQPILKSGFIPPEKKRGETKQQYEFRTKYFQDKFNNRPTSTHSDNKYKKEYKKYLNDLKL